MRTSKKGFINTLVKSL